MEIIKTIENLLVLNLGISLLLILIGFIVVIAIMGIELFTNTQYGILNVKIMYITICLIVNALISAIVREVTFN